MSTIQNLDKRAVFVAFLIALGAIALQPKLLELSSKWAYGSWPLRPQHSHSPSPAQQVPQARSQHTGPAQDQWSKEAIASAFKRYGGMAATESTKMRKAFARLDDESAAMGRAIGYPAKLDSMDDAEVVNAAVCKAIGDMAVGENKLDTASVMANKQGSLFRVRETMWHYVRDWSEEGRVEREVIFKPILELLASLDATGGRSGKSVLLPGSGLGRLAWEISQLGYTSTACEYSQYMNMALRYILNPLVTTLPLAHTIQPWAHRFSHQYTANEIFRTISFPDALPRLSDRFRLIEGDFLKVQPPMDPDGVEGYDYIVSLFFIDTSHNVAQTIKHIHSLLKPGGRWINLGPLLWASGGSVSLELSLEEVKQLAELTGFIMDDGVQPDGMVDRLRVPRGVTCEYTGDSKGMFKRVYNAEFWTAIKA